MLMLVFGLSKADARSRRRSSAESSTPSPTFSTPAPITTISSRFHASLRWSCALPLASYLPYFAGSAHIGATAYVASFWFHSPFLPSSISCPLSVYLPFFRLCSRACRDAFHPLSVRGCVICVCVSVCLCMSVRVSLSHPAIGLVMVFVEWKNSGNKRKTEKDTPEEQICCQDRVSAHRETHALFTCS